MLFDSKLLDHHRKYGLENIRNNVKSLEGINGDNFPKKFDETNGLVWKDKVKDIKRSYKMVSRATSPMNRLCHRVEYPLFLVFYLNKIIDEKENINKVYESFVLNESCSYFSNS